MLDSKTYSEKIRTDVEFAFANLANHTSHAYIDIAGDLVAGTLLSQIIYWCGTGDGSTRTKVFKDGHYWVVKGRNDWYDEIRITARQYDVAIAKLTGKKADKTIDSENALVEVKLFKFNGSPMIHIRPIYENINREIDKWKEDRKAQIEKQDNEYVNLILTKCKNPNSQNVKIDINNMSKSLTEINNIDYNKDYNRDIYTADNQPVNKNSDDIYTSVSPKAEEHSSVVSEIVTKVANDIGIDNSEVNDITEDIMSLLNIYTTLSTDKPRNLTKSGLTKIIYSYLMPPENMDLATIDDYNKMLEEYHKTDFGVRGRYKAKITKSLEHFMSDGIRSVLYERIK